MLSVIFDERMALSEGQAGAGRAERGHAALVDMCSKNDGFENGLAMPLTSDLPRFFFYV